MKVTFNSHPFHHVLDMVSAEGGVVLDLVSQGAQVHVLGQVLYHILQLALVHSWKSQQLGLVLSNLKKKGGGAMIGVSSPFMTMCGNGK